MNDITLYILEKKAMEKEAGMIGTAFQGAKNLGRRAMNGAWGKAESGFGKVKDVFNTAMDSSKINRIGDSINRVKSSMAGGKITSAAGAKSARNKAFGLQNLARNQAKLIRPRDIARAKIIGGGLATGATGLAATYGASKLLGGGQPRVPQYNQPPQYNQGGQPQYRRY